MNLIFVILLVSRLMEVNFPNQRFGGRHRISSGMGLDGIHGSWYMDYFTPAEVGWICPVKR